MSGYLGQTPGIGQQQYFTFNCTAGQTTFTGLDSYNYTLNYNVGFVDVFLNGRRLTPISDYTAVDGSTIILLAATSASDILFVSALSQFSLANWITNAVNYVFVATAGQSSFSGSDINGQTLAYVAGALQVSVNGLVLPQNDYAALNGSTVILGSAVNAGDIVQVFSLRTINPINISSWITNNLTNIADYTYIATQGQTNFGGVAFAGGTLAYKPNCIEVIVNGLVLTPADYVATSGTTVVLNLGCNADDTVVIRVFGNTTVAGVYTQAQSDAKYMVNNGPSFSAYNSVAISMTGSGGWTKMALQTKEWDTASCYDNATNYRFTPNVAGYYQVSGGITPQGDCYAWVAVYKNGSLWKYIFDSYNASASGTNVRKAFGSCMVYLNGTTDYIELYATIGSSENIQGANNALTYFQAFLARSA